MADATPQDPHASNLSATFDRYFRRAPCTADQVLAEERERIEADRPPDLVGKDFWALAHSGGGIRSAAFAIGVQQALHADGLMEEFDYLSTVSGGGYAGSALTWFLSRGGVPTEADADAPAAARPARRLGLVAWLRGAFPPVPEVAHRVVDWAKDFPFGSTRVGSESPGGWTNRVLDYLRYHSRYLTPGSGLSGLSFFGSVVQGTLVSSLVYTVLALAGMVGLHRGGMFQSPELGGVPILDDWTPWAVLAGFLGRLPNWPALLAGVLALGLVALATLNSLRTWISAPGAWRYRWMVHNQRWVGRIWTLLLLAGWLAAAEGIGNWILEDLVRGTRSWKAALPVLGAAASIVSGYLQFGSQQRQDPKKAGGSGAGLRLGLGIAGLLFAVTMGTYLLAAWPSPTCLEAVRAGAELRSCPAGDGPVSSWTVFAGLLAFVAVVGGFVNLNLAGPHSVYRSRLAETFLPNPETVVRGRWSPATDADVTTLEEMGRRLSRPFHLINANIILTDSEQARFRGRGGDSFLMSSIHCGSSATGWYGTEVFNRSYFSREGMTLATAMAISGAALNPDTGVGGAGVTRGRAASLLLSFLNLRLGFWAPHPRRRRAWFPPNYLTPGLFSGLLGKGLHEDAPFIQLSDGGHFENLGLYELVRRRPRVIVITDAGADPDYQFADLANALERVRADFGAQIEFWFDLDLRGVVADQEVDGLGYPVAKRGYAVANLWYSDGGADPDEVHPRRPPDGLLLYIKTTLVDGLSADLVGYKRANPAFPDESTADQFFSEPQFEAYRELGFQLTHAMVHEENIAYVAKKRREEQPDAGEPEAADDAEVAAEAPAQGAEHGHDGGAS